MNILKSIARWILQDELRNLQFDLALAKDAETTYRLMIAAHDKPWLKGTSND